LAAKFLDIWKRRARELKKEIYALYLTYFVQMEFLVTLIFQWMEVK